MADDAEDGLDNGLDVHCYINTSFELYPLGKTNLSQQRSHCLFTARGSAAASCSSCNREWLLICFSEEI